MIIWTRWGIVVALLVALGLITGFGVGAIVEPDSGDGSSIVMFTGLGLLLGGAALYGFDHLLLRRFLDKPRPVMVRRNFPQPITLPNGQVQTFEVVPAVDVNTGEPLMERPNSSLFFIPVRFWTFIALGLGAVVFVMGAILYFAA
ncbi:MAG: hypothetical protein ACK5KO_11215 [Arachnia sp.]